MDIKSIVLDLCSYTDEQEWFEFKENWFQPEEIGKSTRLNSSHTDSSRMPSSA